MVPLKTQLPKRGKKRRLRTPGTVAALLAVICDTDTMFVGI